MDPRTLKAFSDHLVIGGLVAGAGTAAGIWLPIGAALLLLALALCRVCWIEDNIHQDLLPAEIMPPGYKACRERRSGLLGLAFGDAGEAFTCPRRLASALRLQAHVWSAFIWAIAAGAMLPVGAPLTFAAGALALLLALRHADYLAVGAAVLSAGAPLPQHMIAGRGPLSQLAVIARRPD